MVVARAPIALAVIVLALTGCSKEKTRTYDETCATAPGAGAMWTNCNLRGADLRGVDLSNSLMNNVDLAGADLTGANLTNAALVEVTAAGANFTDANLDGATVNGGDIHKATYCRTTMPDGSVSDSGC